MAAKLGLEARMAIKELARRQVSNSEIARKLGVMEGAVRYHLRRMAEGAVDGRSRQAHLATGWKGAIEEWLKSEVSETAQLNLAALHEYLTSKVGWAKVKRCPPIREIMPSLILEGALGSLYTVFPRVPLVDDYGQHKDQHPCLTFSLCPKLLLLNRQ